MKRPTGVQPRTLARPAVRRPAAFTLIELLVVMVVIGVLVALLLTVGGRVLRGQKRTATENTMRLVRMAIDSFAAEDPLKSIYDNPRRRDATGALVGRTFGPYPPYQLANRSGTTVATVVEPVSVGFDDLGWRLTRDLSGEAAADPNGYVDIEQGNANDDIRALYAYLAAFAPGTLSDIPESARRPLPDRTDGTPEIINPTGQGSNPPGPGAVDVMGIYDAWGVPLDYFLLVKLEYRADESGQLRWLVTDRLPVLRSAGSEAETVANGTAREEDAIYSEPFPQPAANVLDQVGGLPAAGQPADFGWARAVGLYETYTYVPGE